MFTPATLDQMATDERWLGHGYLRQRQNATDTSDPEALIDPALVVRADQMAVDAANTQNLTYEEFFRWANSKTGRWFGDCMFGGGIEHAPQHLPGTRLH